MIRKMRRAVLPRLTLLLGCSAFSVSDVMATSTSSTSVDRRYWLPGSIALRLESLDSLLNNSHTSFFPQVGLNLDVKDQTPSIIARMGKVLFIDSLQVRCQWLDITLHLARRLTSNASSSSSCSSLHVSRTSSESFRPAPS